MADSARVVLILGLVAFAACKEKTVESPPLPPLRLDTLCTKDADKAPPEEPGRQLAAVLAGRASIESIAPLLDAKVTTVDELLVAIFPAVRGKTLVDQLPPRPPPYTGKINDGFEPRPITFPADWNTNPFKDISWQLWFQSLNWLGGLDKDSAGWVLVDWVEHALHAAPPLEFTWSDHPMAMRLRATLSWVTRYVRQDKPLDRTVLRAAAVIVVTHALGLASASCYVPRHNHGLLQDVALLEQQAGYAGLRDAPRLRDLALARAKKQVEYSVKPDGVHVENSPHYHLFYADLILRVLAATRTDTAPGDPELRATVARVLSVAGQLVQPNHTLPQFGDTGNGDVAPELAKLVQKARDAKVDETVVAELEWIATRGAQGTKPRVVDATFGGGGYAAFRSAWTTDDQAVTAHFRTGHWARAHYHPDDTGIEIYGFGRELVLGSGVHGYDKKDPFAAYQVSPAAHNILVVDGLAEVDRKHHGGAKIQAHGSEGDLVWVRGNNPNYQKLGVGVVRTFAYQKPDASFAVIDHVVADGKQHRYAQHFHLHPTLSAVRQDGNTVIAQTADGKGPSITFSTVDKADVELARGVREPTKVAGWHFPDKYKEEPATEIAIRQTQDRPRLSLPVLLLVAPPGSAPRVPSGMTYTEAGGSIILTWSENGRTQKVQLPLPPPAP